VVASADITGFNSDQFDASIRVGKGDWENTTSIRLFNKLLIPVCHPSLIKKCKGPLTPLQVVEHPLILNSCMPGTWEKWFQSAGLEMPSVEGSLFQVQNSAQVAEAIQSGEPIGLLDKNFIQQDIESGRLSIACEHILHDDVGYFLTYPESSKALPSLQDFLDWLCTQLDIDIAPEIKK
jgi:LysR family glycine cleavage system transcriptional activator